MINTEPDEVKSNCNTIKMELTSGAGKLMDRHNISCNVVRMEWQDEARKHGIKIELID